MYLHNMTFNDLSHTYYALEIDMIAGRTAELGPELEPFRRVLTRRGDFDFVDFPNQNSVLIPSSLLPLHFTFILALH